MAEQPSMPSLIRVSTLHGNPSAVLPNGSSISGRVTNWTFSDRHEDWAQLRSDLSVALNSVSSGHYVQNSEAKTLSGESRWSGEKRLIDRVQCEFGTALCEQHLAGARANNTFFR